MTHEELCERARRWLLGSRRCLPVYSNVAACREIPDAIGWSGCREWKGSTVIECKTTVGDFHNDRRKPEQFKMGDYRFYLCPIGLLSRDLIERYAPDHGLLLADGRVIWKRLDAPRRTDVNKDAEIQFLRRAIVNGKVPYENDDPVLREGNDFCSFA